MTSQRSSSLSDRSLPRRAFLRGAGALGAVSLALPALPSLLRAEPGRRPKRLVVFFSPNGIPKRDWWPEASHGDRSFAMSRCLEPLARHRDEMTIIRGLDNRVICKRGYGDGHERGLVSLMTGWYMNRGPFTGGSGYAAGPSLDQVVADHVGEGAAFRSLQVGIVSRRGDNHNRETIVFRGADDPLFMENNARELFTRVFGDTSLDDRQRQLMRRRRSRVLDHVRGDLGALRSQLSPEDRDRLGHYVDSVDTLEQRLDDAVDRPGAALCLAPDKPPELDWNHYKNISEVADIQIDQTVAALACDRTRVATIQFTKGLGYYIQPPGYSERVSWHYLSHKGDQTTTETLIDIERMVASKFSRLLDRMKEVTEADGTTLLDNSVVLWVHSMNSALEHIYEDLPIILAGGCQGTFDTGRYLEIGDVQPDRSVRCSKTRTVNHNDLLLTVAQAMGVPIDTIGDPEFCSGPLSQLLA